MNDNYWVVQENCKDLFKDKNLYHNSFANSGLEPYSEYYASQIAKTMGLHYVDYGLSKWKGKLCSTCLLFTNENISYIPVGRNYSKKSFRIIRIVEHIYYFHFKLINYLTIS